MRKYVVWWGIMWCVTVLCDVVGSDVAGREGVLHK